MANNGSVATNFTFRTNRPGDIGHIISRHGALYANEYAWDERFEALVARIAADFIDQYDPKKDRAWIAEKDGIFQGCVLLVKDKDVVNTAKLRLLLVEPSARGTGLGSLLVRHAIEFAREAGYQRIVLWTQKVLTSARRIYEREGFKLVQTEEHDTIGIRLVGEFWELNLREAVAITDGAM